MRKTINKTAIFGAIGICFIGFGGCAGTLEEVKNAGRPPALSPIEDPAYAATGRHQIVMPMPQDYSRATASNSLWQAGKQTFFSDPRASRVGDILTVNIEIDEKAQLNDSSTRTRSGKQSGGVSHFFGLEQIPGKVLPSGFDPANMIGTTTSGDFAGSGQVNRQEKVKLTVAAMVSQVLPNGNLVVAGRQEVRINNEIRELMVSGIVRPQDISAANMVQHTQMAEARISYGGRGMISNYQSPPKGQQILGAISPF
ncbi:MAG: flagellar basal body L-ring protein FlgH [Caulobacterales bacterium]|nr:flagellar basal body L-ring protein FlgH [Caulobacterales bacterium]MCA0372804.1 flagellar basal body L-ring protein FlgH [Pseudomonadota bacterium]